VGLDSAPKCQADADRCGRYGVCPTVPVFLDPQLFFFILVISFLGLFKKAFTIVILARHDYAHMWRGTFVFLLPSMAQHTIF